MHVLLLCEAVTLAHSARVAVLARALATRGHRVTVAGAAPLTRFEHPGVAWRALGCIGAQRFVAALASGRSAYTEQDLHGYVDEERRCIDDVAPDIVAADFRPTAAVSARAAGVPCATIINAYWSPAAGGALPMPVLPFTRWLPLPIAQRLFDLGSKWALASFCRPWNRVRMAHGLEDLGIDLRRIYCDGDAVLYPDVPGMFIDGELPPGHHWLGPLLWSPEVARPAWWPDVPRDRPVAYLTLGSSGDPRLFDTVVAGLRAAGLAVVAAPAGAAPGPAGQGPDVYTAPYLPGDAATAAADLVVCNGGAMTCQQAFACGKPVLGIAGNMDQFLNMAGVAAAGAGALIRADRLSAPGVALAAGALTGERRFREASSRLGSRMDPATPAQRFERAVERLATGAQAPARAGPPVATAGM
jgi:UDP:flavonoid glycosyltransferase YjiC (YdhE family)